MRSNCSGTSGAWASSGGESPIPEPSIAAAPVRGRDGQAINVFPYMGIPVQRDSARPSNHFKSLIDKSSRKCPGVFGRRLAMRDQER